MAPAADMDLASAFELLAPSLRVFQRAVGCLAKLGRDAAVIFRTDELVLHGADDAHSAAIQFAFRRRCFRSTPAVRAAMSGPSALAFTGEASVVVVARALLGALRGAQQRMADSLTVGLSRDSEQPKLVLQFTARFGATVRHRVPLLDTSAFLPGEPSAGPHTAALSPGLLSRVLDHCSPSTKGACEEVTVVAEPKEGIRVRSLNLLGGGAKSETQETRSEVLIQRSDLEACQLDARGGEVTLSGRGLRDFAKATEGYVRDLDSLGLLEGSPLLELRFGCDGSTVLCRLATATEGVVRNPQDFSALLLIATRDLSENAPRQECLGGTQPGRAPSGAGAPETQPAATQGVSVAGRRPQPKQGSKRRAVALPAASAFDAFPEHSASGASQPATIPSTPVPPCGTPTRHLLSQGSAAAAGMAGVTPTAPSVRPHVVREFTQPSPAAAGFAVQHVNCPPTAQSPASMPFHVGMADSMPLLHPSGDHSLSSAPTTQPARLVGHVHPAHTNSVSGPAHAMPVSRPQLQEVPRPLMAEPETVASSSSHFSGQESRPFLFQGGRDISLGRGQAAPTRSPVVQSDVGTGSTTFLASQLAAKALCVPDTDDEELGADPDEVAFARGDAADESVDWFDVDKLW